MNYELVPYDPLARVHLIIQGVLALTLAAGALSGMLAAATPVPHKLAYRIVMVCVGFACAIGCAMAVVFTVGG